ncbi:MAG: hypothetical protein QW794_03460 [Thermosphaera sp.]
MSVTKELKDEGRHILGRLRDEIAIGVVPHAIGITTNGLWISL